jgi:hypothetical protein
MLGSWGVKTAGRKNHGGQCGLDFAGGAASGTGPVYLPAIPFKYARISSGKSSL